MDRSRLPIQANSEISVENSTGINLILMSSLSPFIGASLDEVTLGVDYDDNVD
jgi:hypothetical protein